MLKIYRDKPKTFEFAVQVEGASQIDDTRLVLEADGSRFIYMLRGTVKSDNKCTINIPAINEQFTKGTAHLEVVADGMLFKPWKDDFSVDRSIKVEVKGIDVEDKTVVPKVMVEIKGQKPKPTRDLSPLLGFKKALEIYRALDNDSKKEMHEAVMKFKPNEALITEVRQHSFGKDPRTFYARLYMYASNAARERRKSK